MQDLTTHKRCAAHIISIVTITAFCISLVGCKSVQLVQVDPQDRGQVADLEKLVAKSTLRSIVILKDSSVVGIRQLRLGADTLWADQRSGFKGYPLDEVEAVEILPGSGKFGSAIGGTIGGLGGAILGALISEQQCTDDASGLEGIRELDQCYNKVYTGALLGLGIGGIIGVMQGGDLAKVTRRFAITDHSEVAITPVGISVKLDINRSAKKE